MVTYVEEKEGLQARAEGTTGRRKAKKAKLKRVGFGTLEVRLYPITLGDNPACTRGPPITIEWDYIMKHIMSVNLWESNRPSRRRGRELRTDWLCRKQMLEGGASDTEIAEANKELFKIKKRRINTRGRMKFEKIEIFTESLCRKAKRALAGSSKRSFVLREP